MVLECPTGSAEEPKGEPVGALYFIDDGTWSLRHGSEIPEWHKEQIKEFVEFIYFCTGREEIVRDFQKYQKNKRREDSEAWRRKMFRLIDGEK